MRLPITRSAPSSSFSTKRGMSLEVVGQIGVGHDDVVAARGREAGEVGAAVAAPRLEHHERSGARAQCPRCRRSEPLSATITSPSQPWPSSASRAFVTQRSIDAASLRHGMTTDTLTAPGSSWSAPGNLDVCSTVLREKAPSLKAAVEPYERANDGRSRACWRGDGSERSASLRRLHADLPGLRLPLPLHRRRRRALVSQPRRAPGGGRPRGHLPHPAPVGARRPRRGARECGSSAVGPRMALYAEAGRRRISAAARVRRGRALASAAARAPLRRGPHRVVPVLLAAGGRRGAARGRLSAGGRLARGLDPGVLGRVPRRGRRADRQRSCRRSACACPSARSASRAFTPRGWSREGCEAGRRCWRASTPDRSSRRLHLRRRAAGRLRRPPHPGEARACAGARAGGAAAHTSGRARA